jgi:hypothetical protein
LPWPSLLSRFFGLILLTISRKQRSEDRALVIEKLLLGVSSQRDLIVPEPRAGHFRLSLDSVAKLQKCRAVTRCPKSARTDP